MLDTQLLVILLVIAAVIAALAIYILKGAATSSKIESAIKWVKIKDYQKAISILKGLVNKNDSNSEAHYYLGECYFQGKNYEWALPEYKRVLRVNKYDKDFTEASVRLRLADIYLHFQQFEEAQAEFLLVIKVEPNNEKSYFQIGKIYVERDHLDKAAGYIKKALDISPTLTEALFYSGMIKYRMRLHSEALLDLDKCVAQDKTLYKAYYYMGMVNYHVRNQQKALQNFDLASRDKEYRIRSIFQRGIILMDLNEVDQAIVELEKAAASIQDEDSLARNIRYQLANAYESKKDITAAIEQWEKIAQSQPDFKNIQEKLSNYADLRMEDHLKDFFVASNTAFGSICRAVMKQLHMHVTEEVSVGSVLAVYYVEEKGNNAIRGHKTLVRMYRQNEPVGDKVVREIIDQMKKEGGVNRSLCISATGFSKTAIEYSETRPINLIAGKELSNLLAKVN
ncbi:MAG: hypothetical protein IEMM0008_0430 [bacterium]|nr:MAG: hypothetical protein IEMM0008_0430 [bacterium]